jgi:anti-anti-sigma factor
MSHASADRQLLTEVAGPLTIVRLVGDRIDLSEADSRWLREALHALADEGRHQLAVNLSNVRFLTSTTIEVLLGLHRRLAALGGHLTVCAATPPVSEVFSVLKLDTILDVRPTVPTADETD